MASGYGRTRKKTEKREKLIITFDPDARKDYLTGFHKRKLERQAKAKEEIKMRERKERIEDRKKVESALLLLVIFICPEERRDDKKVWRI
jgi:ribosomal RNA-processing protein 17